MKYASIDLETTGLGPDTCEIVEIGVVLEDTANPRPVADLPSFHAYLLPGSATGCFKGEPYALSMHPAIFRRIATKEKGYQYLHPASVAAELAEFLSEHGFEYGQTPGAAKLTCTGKNFATFDLPFLRALPNWGLNIKTAHRVLDPGSMYARPDDRTLPDTKECCRRAELTVDDAQAHAAVYDARMVVALVRKHWGIAL